MTGPRKMGLQKTGKDTWRAPDWETFVDWAEADCEAIFDWGGTDYFITCIGGAGHDGWFVALFEPFRKDFTYDAVTKDCDTLEELADQPMPGGHTLRQRYRELTLY